MPKKPGPACGICAHRERAPIELGLARGVSVGAIAQRYGVSTWQLYRHKAHMPAHLKASLIAGPGIELDAEKLHETESQSLLANIAALRHRLFAALDVAEEAGDVNMVTRVSGQLHKNYEITGRLLGSLNLGSTNITNNVLVSPVYMDMRVALVQALAPFPEARQAVAAVLHQVETKAAAEIAVEPEYAR